MEDVTEEEEEAETAAPVTNRRSAIRNGAGVTGTAPTAEDDSDTPWVAETPASTPVDAEGTKFDDSPVSEDDFD